MENEGGENYMYTYMYNCRVHWCEALNEGSTCIL